MDLTLKDKVVAITGGAKGIGAQIGRTVAEEGAIPVIVDKDENSGQELECKLLRKGAQAKHIALELADAPRSREAVARTLEAFKQIDALVNNAGVNDKVGLEHASPEGYCASLRRNLLHYYEMAHFALSALRNSPACILNIASKTALTGRGGTSGCASAKGAILALTREWAVELLPCGIRVSAIVPAEVMTPLYQQWLSTFQNPEQKLQETVSKIPLGKRMTTAAEISAMAAFLISDKTSHITGQHVFVVFVQHTSPGTSEKLAANYLKFHLLGFMIERFAGSAVMKVIAAPRLLLIFAAGALISLLVVISTSGLAPIWALVFIGFFHSIMLPTIFALSVKGLGSYTKRGSSLLVMSIIGGAMIPALIGYIFDASSIQRAFIVPLACYVYVLYFALRGYRPVTVEQAGGTVRLGVEAR